MSLNRISSSTSSQAISQQTISSKQLEKSTKSGLSLLISNISNLVSTDIKAPLHHIPIGLKQDLRICDEDIKQVSMAFANSLNNYISSNPEKHIAYLNGYSKQYEFEGRLTINNHSIQQVTLPRSVEKLADLYNILLEGHSRYGSMFQSLIKPIKDNNNILSHYLRYSSGKVKPAKALPTQVINESSGTSTKPMLQKIKIAPSKSATDSKYPELRFTDKERERVRDDLTKILSTYLFTGKNADLHNKKLYAQLNLGDSEINQFLTIKDSQISLNAPKDRQELKSFLEQLLSNHRGFGPKLTIFSDTFVKRVKEAIKDTSGVLHKYLKWENGNQLSIVAPSNEELQIHAQKEQESRSVIEQQQKVDLSKEITVLKEQQQPLLERTKLSRYLLKHGSKNWPNLEFNAAKVTTLKHVEIIGNESLDQLKDRLQMMKGNLSGLAGELEYNLMQLPIKSDIETNKYPLTQNSVTQTISDLKTIVKNIEKPNSNWLVRWFFKPQNQATNEIKARLNELEHLHQQLEVHWPNMGNTAWLQSFVAREVERLTDVIVAEKKVMFIRLETPEYKSWKKAIKENLTK